MANDVVTDEMKYTVTYPYRTWDIIGPMFEWCDEQFGSRYKSERWSIAGQWRMTEREGQVGDMYFRDEAVAMMFALRWL